MLVRALACLLVLMAAPATSDAAASFRDSPARRPLPPPAPCDLVITPENAAIALPRIDDASLRVVCVTAGDYRGAGRIDIVASGTPTAPRILRFHPDDGRKAIHRTEHALFEQVLLLGDWWVIQGLTILPRDPATNFFFAILRGDYNVLDGNLLDGIDQPNLEGQTGIFIGAHAGDPAVGNSIQANVIRRGNMQRVPGDYIGIVLFSATPPSSDNDYNLILDNEIYDWGDAIAIAGSSASSCTQAGRPRGTLIEGNDIYLTADKRIDCATGAPSADGDCACAENAIDIKVPGGAEPDAWTRVLNNRIWGFRPTRQPSTCGGSGSNGQAIGGATCAGQLLIAGNAVLDSTAGLHALGSDWIVAANVFHGAHFPASSPWSGALLPLPNGSRMRFEFNTIVSVDNAYDDASAATDTRCNVVVDNLAVTNNANPRGADHVTEYNYLFQSPAANFVGTTNEVFATAEHSQNEPFCFWRRRWTGPELACVPFALPTEASPQNAGIPHCNAELVAPFGFGKIDYASIGAVPEPRAAAGATAALAVLFTLARRRGWRGATGSPRRTRDGSRRNANSEGTSP